MKASLRRSFLALVTLLFALPAVAVTPSDKYSAMPAAVGLSARTLAFESTRDGADLTGWWFEGQKDQPVIVLFGRGHGSMGDLLPVVTGFSSMGFQVMTFDYRDFGPAGPGAVDSLVQLAYASRWVNDGEGALRYAREHANGQPVFAWGQDLGSAVALAAAARLPSNCDALAIEGLFRTLNELLREGGLLQVPGALERHRFLVESSDEPVSAVASLAVPLHVLIAQKDDVTPAVITQEVARHSLSRIDRWIVPDAGHEGTEKRPDYFERVGGWYRRIAAMIRTYKPAVPAEAK